MSMAVIGLTTYALLLSQTNLLTSVVQSQQTLDMMYSSERCSEEDKEMVWRGLPECQPRNTLVKIPLPKNPNILQVIPSQVEVARCAGSCHSGDGLYQRCVAESSHNTSVAVLYEQLVSGGVQEVCGVVQVESHDSCRCGCEEVSCTDLQIYDKRMCKCRCRDQGAMGQCLVQYNKIWDSERCQCQCRPEEWKECSTGFSYDGVYSCQCLPGPPISASTPLLVTLGVLIVVLMVTTASFYMLFKRTKQRLLELKVDRGRNRLFPQD